MITLSDMAKVRSYNLKIKKGGRRNLTIKFDRYPSIARLLEVMEENNVGRDVKIEPRSYFANPFTVKLFWYESEN